MSNPERPPIDPDDFPSLDSSLDPIPPMTFTPVEDQSKLSTFSREKQKRLDALPSQPPATMMLPRVNGYTMLGVLGEGGMGTVFRARNNQTSRIVAIKLIGSKHLGSGGERELRERFIRESAAAARLRHPNIVQIYEIGETDKTPYFAMEICDAGSLKDRMHGEPLPFDEVARFMRPIAEAIDFAHIKGIIHRDLKPANVLMSSLADGALRPKVADFGIAKFRDTTEDLTRSGTALGTPAYMSPEQAENSRRVTNASDIWSLGVILYEMLTGVKPFDGETPYEIIVKLSKGNPRPPREIVPSVPRKLEKICLKCLQTDPLQRFATAGELAESLGDYLDTVPDPARPPRRIPWATMGLGLLFLGVSIWLLASWRGAEARIVELKKEAESYPKFVGSGPDPNVGILQKKLQTVEQELATKQEAERVAKEQLATAEETVRQANARIKTLSDGQGGTAQEVTLLTNQLNQAKKKQKEAEASLTQSEQEKLAAQKAIDRIQMELDTAKVTLKDTVAALVKAKADGRSAEGEVSTVKESLRKKTEEWVNARDALDLVKIELETSQRQLREAKTATEVVRSPTASTIRLADAYLDQGRHAEAITQLMTVPPDERNIEWRLTHCGTRGTSYANLPGHEKAVWAVACSPDGTTFASASLDKTIKLWDVRTGVEIRSLAEHDNHVFAVAFSPDGRQLLSAGADKSIKLWNAKTGRVIQTFLGHEGTVWGVRFSPDGTRFASGGADSKVMIWSPDNVKPLKTFDAGPKDVSSVCFTPDGKYVISGGYSNKIRIWDIASGNVWPIDAHQRGINAVDVSPDGKWIASGSEDGTVKLWDYSVPKAKEGGGPMKHDDKVTWVQFSPDGDRLVSCSKDFLVKQWDVRTGQLVALMPGHTRFAQAACYRADGGGLISGGADGMMKLWDIANDHYLTFRGHSKMINSVATSRDGVRVATGSDDSTIRLWDGFGGNLRGLLRGHDGGVNAVSLSEDGGLLASGGGDKTVRLWEVGSLRQISSLTGHRAIVLGVALSPDGTRAVSGDAEGVVKVWDTVTGNAIKTITVPDMQIWTVAISGDNSQIAYGGTDKLAYVFDLIRDRETHAFKGFDDRVTALAFSPSGGFLIGGSSDQTARVWDLMFGREAKVLRGHRGEVRGVDVSRDGTRVFTCASDRSMRIWDPRTGTELLWMVGVTPLTSVAVSGDGNRIVVGGANSETVVFDTRPPNTQADTRDLLFRKAMSRFLPGMHSSAADQFKKPELLNPYGEQFHRRWLSFKINDIGDFSDWDWYDLIRTYEFINQPELQRQARQEFQSRFGDAKQRETAIRLSGVFCNPGFGLLATPAIVENDRKRFEVLQRELDKFGKK